MSAAEPLLVPREPEPGLAQKLVRMLGWACAAVAVGWMLSHLGFLLTPVALALLATYCLSPLVNLLENRRVPRWAAVLLCFTVLLTAVVGLGLAVWPSLEAWLQESPRPGEKSVFEVQLAQRLDAWEAAGRSMYPQLDWKAIFDQARDVLEAQRRGLMETLPALALEALSSLGTPVLAAVIAFFLLLDGAGFLRAVVSLVPNRYFETVLLLVHRVDGQIAAYLRGAASESALVALLLSTLLWLAGMPNALLFGCLYGVLNVIPLLGPLLGASAGLLFALIEPSAPPLGVLAACYGVTYAVDAAVINPLAVGRSLNLHPLVLILGVTIGGGLGGILGMLVSVPAIAVGRAILTTLMDAHRHGRLRRVG